MRRIILTAILLSAGTPVLAQTDLQADKAADPKSVVSEASHSQSSLSSDKKMTPVQEEAARILRFQKAMGATSQVAPNGIKPIELYQTPTQPIAKAAPVPVSETVHTVVKGDTLYNLSKRYNLTVTDLKRANAIDGNSIQLGQSLKIPAIAVQSTTPAQVASVSTSTVKGPAKLKVVEPIPSDAEAQIATDLSIPTIQYYAVLPSDTLSAISRRTCIDTSKLVSTNELTDPNALVPGQRLKLPEGHCLTK